MLFNSLFKNERRIAVGRGRKRKLTLREVIRHLDRLELTIATCTLVRDHLGNEKMENYGQVDVYRERDEKIFVLDNGFCITTPTGMKLRSEIGTDLAEIVSESETGREEIPSPGGEDGDEDGFEDDEDEVEEDGVAPVKSGRPGPGVITDGDAFSERGRRFREAEEDGDEALLGIGQVIRLRFFYRRVPYEIDCQIVSRFKPI